MADRFTGGAHTVAKIRALAEYLSLYTKALQDQGFGLVYIDAFAGSGTFQLGRASPEFQEDMIDAEGRISLPGSARVALNTTPPFHGLVFIEQNPSAVDALNSLKSEFPDQGIVVRHGDANAELRKICQQTPWRSPPSKYRGIRAVLFLDPFALHVDWSTLVEIGRTGAIDVWYLFPVGAISRMIPHRRDKVTPQGIEHLNRVLGGDWWLDEFYDRPEIAEDLFGVVETPEQRTSDFDRRGLEAKFTERLGEHFGYVHPHGLRLRKDGQHYFSLVYAMANRSLTARALGRKFAEWIIDGPQKVTRRQRSTEGKLRDPGIV
jgi:three-Cys-motif partner protein